MSRFPPIKASPANEIVIEWARRLLDVAVRRGVVLRMYGSAAVFAHCQNHDNAVSGSKAFVFGDLDLVTRGSQRRAVETMFSSLGFEADSSNAAIPGAPTRVFYLAREGKIELRVDVSFERLEFCHSVIIGDRLTVDEPTIPLAELLLSKLQIAMPSERDLLHIRLLLAEHPVGDSDRETICREVLEKHLGRDYALWATVHQNVQRVRACAPSLVSSAETALETGLNRLEQILHSGKWTITWRLQRFAARWLPFLGEPNAVEPIGVPMGKHLEPWKV